MGCDPERAFRSCPPRQLQHISHLAPLLCVGGHGVVHLGRHRGNRTPGPSASADTCPLMGRVHHQATNHRWVRWARRRRPWPGEEGDRCACDRLLAGPTGLQRRHEPITPPFTNPHQTMPRGVVRACAPRHYGALPPGEECSSSSLRFTVPRVAPYIPLERQDRTGHNSIIYVLISEGTRRIRYFQRTCGPLTPHVRIRYFQRMAGPLHLPGS